MEVRVYKGFLIYAEGQAYVQQAYALALSIKYSQEETKSVSLVTADSVPEEYKSVFERIIPIPWYDSPGGKYSAEHRWKMYHASPYEETIVLDADMLLLEDITTWWNYCSNFDIKFCNRIKNYKLDTVVDTVHRKAFIANQLTSPYFALHYFKKSDSALEFYRVLEFVCNNWEWCWTNFAPNEYQNWSSMDLATAIAIEISMNYISVNDQNSPLEFIHMKPALQGWQDPIDRWQDVITYVLNSKGDLIVGNIKQSKLFHYVEKDFIDLNTISRLQELVYGKKD
jgi:hypothetical protein